MSSDTVKCSLPQGIVPQSASNAVKELFVPESRRESARAEAESLPALEITKVGTRDRPSSSSHMHC